MCYSGNSLSQEGKYLVRLIYGQLTSSLQPHLLLSPIPSSSSPRLPIPCPRAAIACGYTVPHQPGAASLLSPLPSDSKHSGDHGQTPQLTSLHKEIYISHFKPFHMISRTVQLLALCPPVTGSRNFIFTSVGKLNPVTILLELLSH